MRLAHVTLLEEFGTRSLAIHGIMVLAFVNAILAGLFVGGQLGSISFVALLNFTAGLWIAHSIHSLGNATSADNYSGVLNELFDSGDDASSSGFDTGRFGRLLALIAVVTGASLLTSAQALSGAVFSIAVVAVGTIAVLTAGVGFMIALGASYDASESRRLEEMDRQGESADTDGQHVDDR